MLNKLFKRTTTGEVKVKEPIKENEAMNKIIEEIHESFYTEVDRLLANAKIMKSVESTKLDLIEKSHRLTAL